MTEPEIQRPPKKLGRWNDGKQKRESLILVKRRHLRATVSCVKRPSLDEANQYFTQTPHPSRKSEYTALDMVKNKKHTKMVSEHERHFTGASYDASKCSQVTKKYIHIHHRPASPAPPPPQTHLLYTNSDTKGCQMPTEIWGSFLAGMAQTPIRSQMRSCIQPSMWLPRWPWSLSITTNKNAGKLQRGDCLGGI